jgi:hypothetical protein
MELGLFHDDCPDVLRAHHEGYDDRASGQVPGELAPGGLSLIHSRHSPTKLDGIESSVRAAQLKSHCRGTSTYLAPIVNQVEENEGIVNLVKPPGEHLERLTVVTPRTLELAVLLATVSSAGQLNDAKRATASTPLYNCAPRT